MKSCKLWMLVAVILAGVVFVLGQTQLSAFAQNARLDSSAAGLPVRDPQAVAVVERALAALGGHEVHKRFRTAVIRGTMQMPDSQDAASFLWEDDLSGKIHEFRKEIRFGNSVRTLVSGHGTPTHNHDGKARPMVSQSVWSFPPFYLPGVVLTREVNNQSYGIQLIQDSSGGGSIHVRIAWGLNPATVSSDAQDWYFDPASGLPVRVEYKLSDTEKPGHWAGASIEFADFRNTSGLAVPFHMTNHGVDGKARVFTVTDVQTNAAISAAHFEMQGAQ